MFKLILCLSLVFVNSFAVASSLVKSTNPWVKVSQSIEEAKTNEEFRTMQKNYPELFADFDANIVLSAFIIFENWQFQAQTTCVAGDSRLLFKSASFGICLNDVDGTCFSQSMPLPSSDPCGK